MYVFDWQKRGVPYVSHRALPFVMLLLLLCIHYRLISGALQAVVEQLHRTVHRWL